MTEEELEIMENEIMDGIDSVLRSLESIEDKQDLISMILDDVDTRFNELVEED